MSLFDESKRILVVGEVFVDRHLDFNVVRMGGIFHAARALDAAGARYAAAYICPAYLNHDCERFLADLSCSRSLKIGNVVGAPNVFEIGHSGEARNQGYVDLLGSGRKIALDPEGAAAHLIDFAPTDVLIIAGDWDSAWVSRLLPTARIHVDCDHDRERRWKLELHKETVFSSTSGSPFEDSGRDPASFRRAWSAVHVSNIVLKENRGGSRLWGWGDDSPMIVPAYPTRTQHSVGVGDCFDAIYVACAEAHSREHRLRFASFAASLYAATYSHDEFRRDLRTATRISSEILTLEGKYLGWDSRLEKSIYLAAPDFPHVDVGDLDKLEESLRYHNFNPRRPIKENGLGNSEMTIEQRRELYSKDIELLDQCELLIALPLINDPGTFSELGWFANSGRPTILYDPRHQTKNLFVSSLAMRVCKNLTEVIDSVFEMLGESQSAR